jgi:DNA-directed RNA polymerase subunit H (RpoH/RPB5)
MYRHRQVVPVLSHPIQITTLVVFYTEEDHGTQNLLYNTFESVKKGITTTIFQHALNRVNVPTHITILSPTFSMPAARFLSDQDVPFTVEVIEHRIFSYDRMESMLVPEYRVMTESEITEQEKKLKVGREKWPEILGTDPIIKYLGIGLGSCVSFQDYHNGSIMRTVTGEKK